MKYTVVWVRTADEALTNLWLSARDRTAVTEAARVIDADLKFEPQEVGESRPFEQRILFEFPLAVLFTVHEQDRKVKVVRVWRIRRRV
jgi:hypothetical protein